MTDTAVIDARGDSYERGRTQGAFSGQAVRRHREAMLEALGRSGIAEPAEYVTTMLAETRFADAVAEHAPHLLDEIAGIADGAGVGQDDVFALQLIDEEWAYRVRSRATQPQSKCSSFALREALSSTTWIGQNMDLGAYTDGFQRLVQHAPDAGRPGMLILTLDGVIALLGVNDAGVGVCVNSLPQLPSAPTGVPVAFVIRMLLGCRSAAEAAALCRALPHATNQHYLIADPDGIVSLECSAAGVEEYAPPAPDRVLHTNHPLAGDAVDRYPAREVNSVARLRSLEGRLAEGARGQADLVGALGAFDDPDHPVCRLRSDELGIISFTTGAMVSALRRAPAPIESLVSFGPSSERGWRTYTLDPAAPARADG